jgi:hypothetical protein
MAFEVAADIRKKPVDVFKEKNLKKNTEIKRFQK